MVLVSEVELDQWVQLHPREAQTLVVELVYRLVSASVPRPTTRSFPVGDGVNQPGPDGILETVLGFQPFVPEGKSLWEVGTGQHPRDKASSDYDDLTKAVPADERSKTTFVFVTPRSGTSGWGHTWKPQQQQAWLLDRRGRGDWRDVRVLDATQIVDWLQSFPAVDDWLARSMNLATGRYDTADRRWGTLQTIGDPPPLPPAVFLANREEACTRVREALRGDLPWLQLDTHLPEQVGDFVAACIEALDPDERVAASSRTLIVEDADAWSAFVRLPEEHVLVADFDLATEDQYNMRLREVARRANHTVILGGPPGGIPHASRVPLHEPRIEQLGDALKLGGYPEERARTLAQKSGGRVQTLLRLLQEMSLLPEWATGTDASELTIAEILGAWKESSDGDKAVVEAISGKAYGEWIGSIRESVARPGTPLRHRDGVWRVSPRYEAWFALGPRVFPAQLEEVVTQSVAVLSEMDPQFELPVDERYMAAIRGKVPEHSSALRDGLAETLALCGSFPGALTRCPAGVAEEAASRAVGAVLKSDDWTTWASVQGHLPLLAEAAPVQFLDSMERALAASPSPFTELFAQESNGVMGRTYMSGVLWAIETLAWNPRYLARALSVLGSLASIDPGGNWANRPKESLRDILLPWHPQTVANVEQRFSAVQALSVDNPDVFWALLMDLLPGSHSATSGTRRPAWRTFIPDDWTPSVTVDDYRAQLTGYLGLALELAEGSVGRLTALVDKLDDLDHPLRAKLLEAIGAEWVLALDDDEREPLWLALEALVARHRKYSDTEWALPSSAVEEIGALAEGLRPTRKSLESRRLFTDRDFDLMEEAHGDYEAQQRKLDEWRRKAVGEVLADEGSEAVIELARSVSAPWKVGWALGEIAELAAERMLPSQLDSGEDALRQLAGGYVRARFRASGWEWVDGVDMSSWTRAQVAQFMAFLPFGSTTWHRAEALLTGAVDEYWTRVNANGYESEEDHSEAALRLVEYDRAWAAIDILASDLRHKRELDPDVVLQVLNAGVRLSASGRMDVHDATQLISALQANPAADRDAVCAVEWLYLPALDGYHGDARPHCLHERLSTDAAFFCELLRIIYRAESEVGKDQPPISEQDALNAQNAYRLLDGWKRVPGVDDEGSLDGNALLKWWDAASAQAEIDERLRVAKGQLGKVLAWAPSDPEGLWIHRAAADLLNRADLEEARRGFDLAIYNSRGIHSYTRGKAELSLAEEYDSKAEAVADAGLHRLAESIRQIADGYRREAARESERDPFED